MVLLYRSSYFAKQYLSYVPRTGLCWHELKISSSPLRLLSVTALVCGRITGPRFQAIISAIRLTSQHNC